MKKMKKMETLLFDEQYYKLKILSTKIDLNEATIINLAIETLYQIYEAPPGYVTNRGNILKVIKAIKEIN